MPIGRLMPVINDPSTPRKWRGRQTSPFPLSDLPFGLVIHGNSTSLKSILYQSLRSPTTRRTKQPNFPHRSTPAVFYGPAWSARCKWSVGY
ncbi:hypothetical protein AVEN_242350-1 [Araneus ventricosus]|uniref:Uncharacterized protein n=1 Tax=Araneus ventricosus TaxID=182803 RepID=A0A4Y2I7K4_ARAVE|nr:hypothetical protein AVEN_242350-1 [Araneus ventricosus]